MITGTCCTEPEGTESRANKVLLVDDHPIIQEGLRLMLRRSAEF